jgi:hypothetical protein
MELQLRQYFQGSGPALRRISRKRRHPVNTAESIGSDPIRLRGDLGNLRDRGDADHPGEPQHESESQQQFRSESHVTEYPSAARPGEAPDSSSGDTSPALIR